MSWIFLVTYHRDKRAAKRFFRKVLKHQARPPCHLVTDKLRSYPAAHREVFPSVTHRTGQYGRVGMWRGGLGAAYLFPALSAPVPH